MSGDSEVPRENNPPPESGRKRQKPQVSVIFEERILNDPILAKHFEGLETPGAPELIEDPFDILASPHRLRTSHRLVRTTDAAGIKYVNQYIVIKLLGYGSYGKVKLCLNTQDSNLYAIKIVDRKRLIDRRLSCDKQDDNVLQGSMLEIAILKKLNHPNIVALHEVIDDVHQRKLYLVLEYVEGGPIMETNHGVAIAEEQARKYFREICRGLDYLHYHKVLHRDLKPENLLKAADGVIKISDFGVSRVFEKTDAVSSTAGTPAFLAPEVCSQSSYEGRPVDIWALGVCLYVFVFGVVPFPAKSIPDTYHAIVHKELAFHSSHKISKELKDLLGALPALHSLLKSNPQAGVMLSVSQDELQSAYTTNASGMDTLCNVGVEERKYEPGEYIVRQGEEEHEMFFIDSGKCEVVVESDAEAKLGGETVEYCIAKRGPGQIVGEMALFSQPTPEKGPRRQASIRARTPVTTLVVKNSKVMEALAQNPTAMESMKETLRRCELDSSPNRPNGLEMGTPRIREVPETAKCRCVDLRWCTVM